VAGEGRVAGKDGIERKHRCTVLLKLLEDSGRSSYQLPGARVAARAQRTDYDLAASVGK
jgi:hypothetical protein